MTATNPILEAFTRRYLELSDLGWSPSIPLIQLLHAMKSGQTVVAITGCDDVITAFIVRRNPHTQFFFDAAGSFIEPSNAPA
jgi:hypothetical protein